MSASVLKGRTLSRAQAIQLLFQAEHNKRSIAEVLASPYLVTDGPASEYAQELALGVEKNQGTYLDILSRTMSNWGISRVASVDKAIMLIALYEVYEVDDVDTSVAISEAVELAKLFGGDDSYKFVNGVLGAISKTLEEEGSHGKS